MKQIRKKKKDKSSDEESLYREVKKQPYVRLISSEEDDYSEARKNADPEVLHYKDISPRELSAKSKKKNKRKKNTKRKNKSKKKNNTTKKNKKKSKKNKHLRKSKKKNRSRKNK